MFRAGGPTLQSINFQELYEKIQLISFGFIKLGIQKGDRIGLWQTVDQSSCGLQWGLLTLVPLMCRAGRMRLRRICSIFLIMLPVAQSFLKI
jgi:hypothetical protein